ncbi:MAG: hypothetical protein HKN80_08935 [Acidimicrobiia bacterium]|nr:hypothetical protein [Acidimicrobiia bacterium]
MHIHELKGDGKDRGDAPYARIEVHIRTGDDRNLRAVVVTGRFSGGYSGLVSASTNARGKVTFESGLVTGDSVTFTVTNLVHSDYAYAPEDNRQGPSVTVEVD